MQQSQLEATAPEYGSAGKDLNKWGSTTTTSQASQA